MARIQTRQTVEEKPMPTLETPGRVINPENRFYIGEARKDIPVNTGSIEAMTRDSDKMVTGTFINIECPGQPARVCGKYYKGMPYFAKTFLDNEEATIPWSVARWINERVVHEKHESILDEKGAPAKGKKNYARYKFMITHM